MCFSWVYFIHDPVCQCHGMERILCLYVLLFVWWCWHVFRLHGLFNVIVDCGVFGIAHVFMAVFDAQRYDINTKKVTAIFLRWPIVTVSIVRAIYWQAFKLYIKGIRYVPYQTKQQELPTVIAGKPNTKSKP